MSRTEKTLDQTRTARTKIEGILTSQRRSWISLNYSETKMEDKIKTIPIYCARAVNLRPCSPHTCIPFNPYNLKGNVACSCSCSLPNRLYSTSTEATETLLSWQNNTDFQHVELSNQLHLPCIYPDMHTVPKCSFDFVNYKSRYTNLNLCCDSFPATNHFANIIDHHYPPTTGGQVYGYNEFNCNNNNNNDYSAKNKESFLAGTNLGPVINLSSFQLTTPMIELLSKGLNFCPTPGEPERFQLRQDLDKFHVSLRRKLMFKSFADAALLGNNTLTLPDENFSSEESSPFDHYKFKNASNWNPPAPFQLETFITLNESRLNEYKFPSNSPSNLIHQEKLALTDLIKATDIIIKPADKGSAVVIQDLNDYIQEGLRQLSDPKFYVETPHDFTELHQELINNLIDYLENTGEISKKCANYLRIPNPRTSQLYLLPKIHKRKIPIPGRPIVSANNSPTERISELADFFLKPLVQSTRSYIRDTTDFINKVELLNPLPQESYLCTIDVTSLYTNIPNEEGIQACSNILTKHRTDGNPPSNSNIIRMLEHVLYMNNFDFNSRHYLQVGGTAMGTRVAPSFANIFMAEFENKWVYTYHTQPLVWFRYIDDIFMVWNKDRNSLDDFLTHLNECHHSIKFTSEVSSEQIIFLDTLVRPNTDRKLYTDLYCKPTDAHNYLLYNSSHPQHLTRSLPYSQLLRVRRICHYIEDYDKNAILIGQNFLRRGYPENLIIEAIIGARRKDRKILLTPQPAQTPDSNLENSFLVTTFNPDCTPLRAIVEDNWSILGRTVYTEGVFQHPPTFGYRRNKNLKDLLVQAKLNPTPTSDRVKQSRTQERQCIARQCRYCPRLDLTGKIQNTTSGKSYASRTKITCNSNNLIYCIQCTRCSKLYVGQTKNSIKERFKCHFFSIAHPKSSDTTVGRHFSKVDHAGINDVTITVLDFITAPQNTPSGQRIRDEKEKLWIHRLSTIAPLGLNTAD